MTELELVEKAAKEIYGAKTPEEVELYTMLIAYLLMGQKDHAAWGMRRVSV